MPDSQPQISIQTCEYCQAQQAIELTAMGPSEQEEKQAIFMRLHTDPVHVRGAGMQPTCEPTFAVTEQVRYTTRRFSSPGVVYGRMWGGPNARWLYAVWLEKLYQGKPGIITMADTLERVNTSIQRM